MTPPTDASENVSIRTRVEHEGSEANSRGVIYWMATALRAAENPALEAAMEQARRRDAPLLVYHGLFPHEWYASDRTHAFVLEGVEDLRQRLNDRGVRYEFHWVTSRQDDPLDAVCALAAQAALVICEDFPCGPWPAWRAEVAKRSGRPVWCVDTACIYPMNNVGRAHDRAFKFREVTGTPRARWIQQSVTISGPAPERWSEPLPFVPSKVSPESLADLLLSADIDHGVGRVLETVGGEAAAERRWNDFLNNHLKRYHFRRNDSADQAGVSNMSPYLHYGMVAAWTLAREAADQGGPGAVKWLDELLTWRELSWCFCRFRSDHHSVSAIPKWALETLQATAHERSNRPTLEALERGQTGDALYDLCQMSLLRHGMLHNNVRMTWGKALAAWFARVDEGLNFCLDLNHRYALDGRDPNSYGGILWAWGQFDSPKERSQALGTVRSRPTAEHLKRVGEKSYRTTQERNRGGVQRVLVIGAGVSGLMAARSLQDHGVSVTVVDKGRGVGGRLATRRGDDGAAFDHGAQYFTLRDPRLQRHLAQWLDADVVTRWATGFESSDGRKPSEQVDRYVGRGAMTALPKWLARGIDVKTSVKIERFEVQGDEWVAWSDDGKQFRADALVITSPVEQTLDLVAASGLVWDADIRSKLAKVSYDPCFAVMAALDGPSGLPAPGGLFVNDRPEISWIADNQAKGASKTPTVTIHSTGAYARSRFDDNKDDVAAAMIDVARPFISAAILSTTVHRWKFSLPTQTYPAPCQPTTLGGLPVVLAGDAFAGPRVEGAALSGLAAAGALLARGAVAELAEA